MKPRDILDATLLSLVGAIVAAAIVGQVPTLRDWINRQWRR